MDRDLAQTNIGKSFTTKTKLSATTQAGAQRTEGSSSEDENTTEDVGLSQMDVALNVMTNFLESYSSQAGLAGSASNILQSMGIHLPDNTNHHPSNEGSLN
ncbi:protein ecdysoneless homolog [Xenopus laevis]|uniref:Protein ecdysoneless homolog n=1 Tax=Xenopus laevis TaxID=8355 RepID=A0A8J1L5C4_XENLA|nr:protein ecdysoneless homolog [Xenopus laevis]